MKDGVSAHRKGYTALHWSGLHLASTVEEQLDFEDY